MWARYDLSKSKKFHWTLPMRLEQKIYSTPCGLFWLDKSSVIVPHKPNYEDQVCKRCEKWIEKNVKREE
jgi:hypothetical protein